MIINSKYLEFHLFCEKVLKYLISENKNSFDKEKDELVEFLITNNIFNFITEFGTRVILNFYII